jgi:hypothetical protein
VARKIEICKGSRKKSNRAKRLTDSGKGQEKFKGIVRKGDKAELAIERRGFIVFRVTKKSYEAQVFTDFQYPVHGINHHVRSKTFLLHVFCYCQSAKFYSRGSAWVLFCVLIGQLLDEYFTGRQGEKSENFGRILFGHQHKSTGDTLFTMLARGVAKVAVQVGIAAIESAPVVKAVSISILIGIERLLI